MAKSTSFFDWELSFRGGNSESLDGQIDGLLRRFVGKKMLYKAALISEDNCEIFHDRMEEGILTCAIHHNSSEVSIEIDMNEWKITHKCVEFASVNELSLEKRFCSHLAKLFLILKEHSQKIAYEILTHISTHDYRFISR
jgi:hypothetical protein